MKRFIPALAACLAISSTAAAAETPRLDGPLTIVVGYGPGGSSDRTARIVGNALAQELSVPVVVENRAGAGGRLAAQHFTRMDASANTLLLGNPAIMSVAPVVYQNAGYDPKKDFQPVSLMASYTFALAVPATSPIQNLKELKAHLDEQKSGPMNVGVPATGSLPHFFGMMVADALGQEVEVIGYKGSAQLQTELVGEHIPYAIDGFDSLSPLHAGQKIRILAVSGTEREPSAPEIPTFKESGFDIEGIGWNGFWAPAAMPKDKVEYLNQAIVKVMHQPEVQDSLKAAQMGVIIADLDQTQTILDEFDKRWVPVVKQSGFTQ
ncbi:MAG: tripartite tricarboxylate transporter substrate-binding protein [Pigmentiphaga sp.]|nr:tripartite tricarboxylate transporter substrate-binding protein [Pigmentiphaga sp.]